MGKISERMKSMIRNWLNIQPAPITTVSLFERIPYELHIIECLIWYRGKAAELDQFYKQITADSVTREMFWAANTKRTRKIHTGLPAKIVDTLAYLVKSDMDSVSFAKEQDGEKWDKICADENFDFVKTVGKGIVGALTAGDGAWKISVDNRVASVPLVEFYSADRVEYEMHYGIVCGVDFITDIPYKKKNLKLREKYRKGSVSYELYDGDYKYDKKALKKITGLSDISFKNKTSLMFAVPFKIFENPEHPSRGKSIFDGKTDDFDAFDEIVSQWIDSYRKGRVQRYIPENLIPRNEYDGSLKPNNPFDNEYVSIMDSVAEGGSSSNERVQVVQPEIPYEAFESGYAKCLDLCLQGIISPATLGIDLGKMSSGEAQREKKDVTGITRNTITAELEKALPRLVSAILTAYDIMTDGAVSIYEPKVSFGEYGAPDFDSRVETVSKASASGTMSIETQVDEMWGSSKDEEWKEREVIRIKNERGIEIVDEPRVGE